MYIAVAALPGRSELNSLERYFVQSSVRTLANLSRPNRIGATVKAIRSRKNAWAVGSARRSSVRGIGAGRRWAATVLMAESSSVRDQTNDGSTHERPQARGTYPRRGEWPHGDERRALRAVSRRPRVLVAGGSLGGLTAAHVLGDVGCDVTVLERSPEPLTGRGAGIVLHSATVRWWRERDVRPLSEMSAAMRRLRYIDGGGGIAHEQPCRYRVSSFDALYRDLSARLEPPRQRLGCAVAGFEVDGDGVSVALEGGGTERCDLLVGADGIGSRVRRTLLPDVEARYAGYVAWRGTVAEHDLGARAREVLLGAIAYHLMDRSHFLTYPIPGADGSVEEGRRLTNWLWYRNVVEGPDLDALMTDRTGVRRPVSLAPGTVAAEHVDALRAASAEH